MFRRVFFNKFLIRWLQQKPKTQQTLTWASSKIAVRRLHVRSQVPLSTCEPAVLWFRVGTCSGTLFDPRSTGGWTRAPVRPHRVVSVNWEGNKNNWFQLVFVIAYRERTKALLVYLSKKSYQHLGWKLFAGIPMILVSVFLNSTQNSSFLTFLRMSGL